MRCPVYLVITTIDLSLVTILKCLHNFVQALASISFEHEENPIVFCSPLISTHVIGSSGLIIDLYSISGTCFKFNLLYAISKAVLTPPYEANSLTRPDILSGNL